MSNSKYGILEGEKDVGTNRQLAISNAIAIFISAIASLLISKRYYDKANRESVLMTVIFPIVKLLEKRNYTRKNYEALFEINCSYAVKYLRKKKEISCLRY